MAKKDTTVKEADVKAASMKQKSELEKAVMAEAMALTEGKQHSVQQLMAYCRQLKKMK